MKTRTQDLVSLYLKRLGDELHGLTQHQRQEILDEVAGHINESLAATDGASEADVRNVLDRLGDPADIAREAYARFEMKRAKAGFVEATARVPLRAYVAAIGTGLLAAGYFFVAIRSLVYEFGVEDVLIRLIVSLFLAWVTLNMLRTERKYAAVTPNPQSNENPRGLKLFLLVGVILLATFVTGVLVIRVILLALETRDLW